MKFKNEELKVAADAIRVLVADMVEQANSGHPGGAMGQADVAATLWLEYLRVDPKNPLWPDRDRLVFSGGHCSPLVYSLFHLSGMDGLSMDEVKNFRQFGSRTAGHPERELIRGIEVTTGPLGQGLAMGVGLALAAKMKSARNRTWVLCGDGDMEEGISHEACSFAGTLGLGGLVVVYDANDITIEGHATLAMKDDTQARFTSYGWKVFTCDGHDFDAIRAALDAAVAVSDAPVLVISRTHIGRGAPTKHDTAGVHGAPLGAAELAATKRALGYDPDKSFAVPQQAYDLFARRAAAVAQDASARGACEAPAIDVVKLTALLPAFDPAKAVATRAACGMVMNALAEGCAELVRGPRAVEQDGAQEVRLDLGRRLLGAQHPLRNPRTRDDVDRQRHGGVRRAASVRRDVLRLQRLLQARAPSGVPHGPAVPVRLLARQLLRRRRRTHPRAGGADRRAPGRPEPRRVPSGGRQRDGGVLGCHAGPHGGSELHPHDAAESAAVLADATPEKVMRGGYVLLAEGPQDERTVLFVATGSEVHLCVAAAKALAAEGRGVRVVSLPCVELFARQDAAYRASVVPPAMTRRVLAEAGVAKGLMEFAVAPATTRYLSLEHFGASGPYARLADEFGFTPANCLRLARELL